MIPRDLVPAPAPGSLPADLVPASAADEGPGLYSGNSPAPAPGSREEALFQQARVEKENQLRPSNSFEALKSGIRGNVTGTAARFVDKYASQLPDSFQTDPVVAGARAGFGALQQAIAPSDPTFRPTGTMEKIAEFGGTAVDPLGLSIAEGVGQVLPKIPGVGRLFNTSQELLEKRAAAELAFKSMGDVVEPAFKSAASDYVLNRLARSTVKGAAEIGSIEFANTGLNQAVDQQFDPGALVENTVKGMGFGAGLGLLHFGLARERADYFSAGRKAIVEDRFAQAKNGKVESSVAKDLDAQAKKLSDQKVELSKQLDDRYSALREDEKAALVEKVQSLDKQVSDLKLKRDALEQPEAPASSDQNIIRSAEDKKPLTPSGWDSSKAALERASQKAATLDSNLEALHAERENLSWQIKNVSDFGSQTQISKLTDRASKVDQKILDTKALMQSVADEGSKHFDRLNSGLRNLTDGERIALTDNLSEERGKAASRTEKSWIDYHTRVEAINGDLERAIREREMLQKGVDSPYVGLREKDGNLHAQIDELGRKIESLQSDKVASLDGYRDFLQKSGPLSLKQKLSSQFETAPQYFDRAYRYAQSEIDRLVKNGSITEAQRSGFMIHYVQDLLEKKGLKIPKESAMSGNKIIRNFTQKVELMNLADKQNRTRLVDQVYALTQAETNLAHWKVTESVAGHRSINALKARGLSNEMIVSLLEHVETSPEGIPYFNPEAVASKSLTRDALPDRGYLTQFPELIQLRKEFDRLQGFATQDMGYVNGYVPLLQKRGANLVKTSGSIDNVETPSIYQERFSGKRNPAIHESDPNVLYQYYVNSIMKDRAFSPLLPDIFRELNKTLIVGDASSANEFVRVVRDTMGISREDGLSAEFASHLMNSNAPEIRAMLKQANLDESGWSDFFKVVKQMQYESLVLNPKALLFQALQPQLVGAAEIGRYAGVGQKLVLQPKWNTFAKQFDHELIGADPGALEELGLRDLKTRAGRVASKIVSLPGSATQLRRAYSSVEVVNRRATFLGAYTQFSDAFKKGGQDALNGVLDGLLEGEKSRVIRIFKDGGPEAAAQAYGIVRSYRTNFIFSAVNRPEYLREGLGQLVPFATWSTNQLARLTTDLTRLGSGNGAQFLRRTAGVYLGLSALGAVTGYNLMGGHPVGDIYRAFTLSVFPAIQAPIQAAAKTGSAAEGVKAGIREAGKYVPGWSQYDDYKRRIAKTGSVTSSLLRTEPVQDSLAAYLRRRLLNR